MPSSPLLSLIIPAYNEVNRINQTINEARAYFQSSPYTCEIIVVADGNDGTRECVTALAKTDSNLKVFGNVTRRGKGLGIREGVAQARGEIIGFVDADNKTPIAEFAKFAPYLQAGVHVVIGSRGLPDSQIERYQPWYRRWGSTGFGIFMHAMVGLPDIVDTQCGFKFFQGPIARDLFARQKVNGYMFDVEILYLARQAGYTIAQVPIRWRDDGDSRLVLFGGNVRNALDVFRIRFGK